MLRTRVESRDEEDVDLVTEINTTPLTDLFAILLIIFMVTSSALSQMAVDVSLPEASPQMGSSKPEGVIVTLLADGRMRVAEVEVKREDWNAFGEILTKAFEKTSSRLVVLEGDQSAFLGSVMDVMDRARLAGAQSFAVAARTRTE